MDKQPRVTVLMPVFNGAQYLRAAMESILTQTFSDFEFLLMNDGSSDSSVTIINSYSDDRIRLVSNGANLGLIETLNRGLLLARGEYVARMDCDDISHPERLALQVAHMDRHADVAVCGTWLKAFGTQHFVKRYPITDGGIRAHLLFESALAHPSVMFRRELFIAERLFYDPDYVRAEDYELWTRVPDSFRFANLNRILLFYRRHPQQVSAEYLSDQSAVTRTIRKRQLERFGIMPTVETLDLHVKISQKKPEVSLSFLTRAASWLLAIQENNARTGFLDDAVLAEILGLYWWETCFHATALGFQARKCYFGSPLSRKARVSAAYMAIFWVKCLVRKRSTSLAA